MGVSEIEEYLKGAKLTYSRPTPFEEMYAEIAALKARLEEAEGLLLDYEAIAESENDGGLSRRVREFLYGKEQPK